MHWPAQEQTAVFGMDGLDGPIVSVETDRNCATEPVGGNFAVDFE